MTFALSGHEDAAAGAARGDREAGSAGGACTTGDARDAFGKRGGTKRGRRDFEGTREACGAGDAVCTDFTGGGVAGFCTACWRDGASGS